MTTPVEQKFNFKARTIKDDKGEEVGKAKKQAPVTVALPMPTTEEVIAILSRPQEFKEVQDPKTGEVTQEPIEDKEKSLILESVWDIVRSQAKAQFDEVIESFGTDETKVVTAAHLDFDKLTLAFIATIPPAQRGAKAIPEEDFATFYKDYLQVMVPATGKEEKRIKTHIDLFQKPTRIKQNKEALTALVEALDLYTITSPLIEDTSEVVERIKSRFQRWSKEDTKFDVNAL